MDIQSVNSMLAELEELNEFLKAREKAQDDLENNQKVINKVNDEIEKDFEYLLKQCEPYGLIYEKIRQEKEKFENLKTTANAENTNLISIRLKINEMKKHSNYLSNYMERSEDYK